MQHEYKDYIQANVKVQLRYNLMITHNRSNYVHNEIMHVLYNMHSVCTFLSFHCYGFVHIVAVQLLSLLCLYHM